MGEASQADGNETSDPAVAVAFETRLGKVGPWALASEVGKLMILMIDD